MESPEISRTIDMHPINELDYAYEKFYELTTLSPKEQFETFIERFIFTLKNEAGLKKVVGIRKDFEAAIGSQGGRLPEDMAQRKTSIAFFTARKKTSVSNFPLFFTRPKSESPLLQVEQKANSKDFELELNSTAFSEFLERTGKPMPPLQRRSALLGVRSKNGGISLLGYLLYHYRRPIMRDYYFRKGIAATKKMFALQCGKLVGNEEIGFQKRLDEDYLLVGEALVEELMLRHPLGIDVLLDAGMIEFNKVVEPYRQSIFDLNYIIADSSSSRVALNSAKSELPNMRKCYAEAYQRSFSKMKKRIETVRKKQKEKVLNLKHLLARSQMHRVMTLKQN